jgi:5'-nucleotidase/UDP-sugar diphosphatase
MKLNRLLPLAGAALLLSATMVAAQDIPPPPFMQGAPAANNAAIPAPPIPVMRKHTVAKGDSFWKLAKTYYGKGHVWQIIANANPGIKAKGLDVGSMIVIP